MSDYLRPNKTEKYPNAQQQYEINTNVRHENRLSYIK